MPWQFTLPSAEFSTVQVNEHYRVNSGELALKAALAGVGFAILAKVSCQEFIDDGSLVEIELNYPPHHYSCLLFMQIDNIYQLKPAYLLTLYGETS